MRIKILPLLAVVSMIAFSSCTQTVISSGMTVSVPSSHGIKKPVVAHTRNEEKQILIESEGQAPQVEVVDYVFENEIRKFSNLTGAKVVASVPLFGHRPSVKGDLVVIEEPGRVRIVIKDSLIFELNRDRIVDDSILKAFAAAFGDGNSLVAIAAFSDGAGSEDFNASITERRAKAVAERLEVMGISPSRLLVFGCGSSNPIAPNSTVDGRAANRRLEIYVYPEGMFVNNVCGQE
ncbi:OmpA family protein [Desulfurobacterium sp.]